MLAPYLTCHQLSAQYGATTLFQDLSFAVHPGERWGLIGPNGAGKSTLFKMIKGDISPNSGTIALRNSTRVSFIDQKIPFDDSLSVEQILKNSLPHEYDTDAQLEKIEAEISKLEKQAQENPALYEDEKWLENFAQLNHKLSEISGTPTANILQSALKLANLSEYSQTTFKNLSGGQQKRVQIVAALLQNPNLIFMDEPTNHLDVQTVEWLEEFLLQVVEQGLSLFGLKSNERENEPVAFVLISHDRALLDTLVNKILEVEGGQAKQYEGNYEAYSQLKIEFLAQEEKSRQKMANTMRRELEWLRSGTRARTTKQTARIERAHQLDKTLRDKNQKAAQNKNSEISFQGQMVSEERNNEDRMVANHHQLGQQELVVLKSVTLAHPNVEKNKDIFENLNLILKPKMRVAILGPNGSGKSTLLNQIAYKVGPKKGEIKYHELVEISYFDQKRNNIRGDLSIRQNISPKGDTVFFAGKSLHIMSYLERFLFTKYDANRTVSELSGGEQARLLLAKLMLEQGNVLILDEPTNDLDIPTLQVLEKNLTDFNGAVLFTSHDRYFMQRVATNVLAYLGDEGHKSHWGFFTDLNQALEHIEKFEEDLARKAEKKRIVEQNEISAKNTSTEKSGKKKLSFKEQRELEFTEKRIAELEELIPKLSQNLEELYARSASHSETSACMKELEDRQHELNQCFVVWEKYLEV